MTSGEALARQQRRRFWLTLGAIGLVGVPVGMLVGFNAGRHDVGIAEAAAMLSGPAAIAIVAAYALAMVIGTSLFVRVIDEVELLDNLWGSAAGFYAYVILFPAWWLLAATGVAPPVDHWLVFIASSLVATGIYGWRKWRAR